MPADTPWLVFDFYDRRRRRLSFSDPIDVIVAWTVDQVRLALQAVQRAVRGGLYAAGYISYEAAPAFDPAFVTHPGAAMPLLWFGLFRTPAEIDISPGDDRFQLSDWQPAITREAYDQDITTVREAIGRGDTYQVNYTMRLRARFEGDDFAFYEQLRAAQAANYCAYLNIGRYRILSVSPELFFQWQSDEIISRPMKGTARRGRGIAEDRALAAWLASSEKNRAENLMIVDLLRNDIGRIAQIGSVEVPRLFEIERYRTVYQMTSTVRAKVRPNTTLEDVFAALFPCGSITGAPKIQTMKLIAALEDSPREVYCGAIGVVAPDGRAVFNVAIRTVLIDRATGVAEYSVGGGITWDSTAADEYNEALLKAALLGESWPTFELLETLRLEDGTYTLLDRHIDRITQSAEYFNIPLTAPAVRAALEVYAQGYPAGAWRIRLLVSRAGAIRIESQSLQPFSQPYQAVAFARTPVSRSDRFLFHKTTNRSVYETRRAEFTDVFDVLLWNEDGEVTEFTTGNLVIESGGRRWTPPIESGLLAGTLRADLLARGEIRERVLTRADVERASRCWLINSVRGWVPVTFVQ